MQDQASPPTPPLPEPSPAPRDEPAFEACLGALQEIVRALEEGRLGLDESIACFERGVSLLRCCYQALERAEERIEILTGFDDAGNPLMRAFDGAATLGPSQAAPGKRPKTTRARRDQAPGPEPSARDEPLPGGQLF